MKTARQTRRNIAGEPRVRVFILAPALALAALLAILAANVAAAYVAVGGYQFIFNILCALVSVCLVVFFFMELRKEKALNRLCAAAGVAWLALFLLLAFSDYWTRILTPF